MQCHDCAVNDEQEQQPSASVGGETPTPESWSPCLEVLAKSCKVRNENERKEGWESVLLFWVPIYGVF